MQKEKLFYAHGALSRGAFVHKNRERDERDVGERERERRGRRRETSGGDVIWKKKLFYAHGAPSHDALNSFSTTCMPFST